MVARARFFPARRFALTGALVVVLTLVSGVSRAVGPDPALARVDTLIESHAWQLARRALESLPPDSGADPEALERRRITIYRHLPDPAALARRLEQMPEDTSPELRRWAEEQLLEAAFSAGDLARAAASLDRLAAYAAAEDLRLWRERLVRALLDAGRIEEALAAFEPIAESKGAGELRAEILVYAGRDREAFEAVAGMKSPQARLWRLIAALRLDLYAPADAVQELTLLVRELQDRPELQRLAWLMRARAAKQVGQLARQVNSLEQAFRMDEASPTRIAPSSADDLWSAYLALARYLAHTEDLSLGAAALARADASKDNDPHGARALYAWVAIEAREAQLRAVAHARLVADLSARRLDRVARVLYGESRRFVHEEDVPGEVRHVLLAEALRRKDFAGAAEIARELESPPPEVSAADWALRRARILLYGGAADAGIERLKALLGEAALDTESARRLLQVVFDVQALGRHADALALFEAVSARVDDAQLQRELLYWRAESAAALERHADAAELYLRSARFGEADGTDPWGHSARFRAAEALARAGLDRDAETLYRDLLNETASPERRILIEQRIERLWLARPNSTTP